MSAVQRCGEALTALTGICLRELPCSVHGSPKCNFGRLGKMICPPQERCEREATQTVNGIRWCDEHAAYLR